MHRRAISPAVRVALVGVVVHIALAGVLLARYDGDAAWFVHFGRDTVPTALARRVLGPDVVVPHVDGHDGRFFWVLARDPLLVHADEIAANLDRPAYRAQRILYPALAAPWRVAGERALVWGLLVTNLAVVFAGGLVACRLAVALRAPPRAAYAFALSPAVFVAVIMDGSDGLAIAALLAAALALVTPRPRPGWAVVAGVVAALAKEPTIAGLAGIALVVRTIPVRWRVLLVAGPVAAGGAWALYVRWRFGWPASDIQEFAAPFYGYVDAYRRGWRPVGNWADAALAAALVPLAVVVVWRWWRRGGVLLSAAVPFVAMVPFFSAQVLDLAVNTMRAAGPPITLLWLDAYVPAASAIASTGRPPPASRRASLRSRSRSRPSPSGPRG